MMYAILTKEKCEQIGIDYSHRMCHDGMVVVTEKELNFSKAEGDNFELKAQSVGARIKTIDEIKAWDKMYQQIERKEVSHE